MTTYLCVTFLLPPGIKWLNWANTSSQNIPVKASTIELIVVNFHINLNVITVKMKKTRSVSRYHTSKLLKTFVELTYKQLHNCFENIFSTK